MIRFDVRCAWVVAAALVVHIGLLSVVRIRTGAIDTFTFSSLDAREYHAIAVQLAEHGCFSQAADGSCRPDTWRTPGYPLFLAACMHGVGTSPGALIVVQQVLGVLCVGMFHRLARGYLGDRRAIAATAVFLLDPYRLYYSFWLLSTTLLTFFLLVIWMAWRFTERRNRYLGAILVGVCSGYFVLIWPGTILVPALLLPGLLLLTERVPVNIGTPQPWSRHRIAVGALAAGFAFSIVGAWAVRNHFVAGRFALSHQSGVVLAYFKAAEVELWKKGRTADRYLETSLDPGQAQQPHRVWESIDQEIRGRFQELPPDRTSALHWRNLAQGNKSSIDDFQIDDELRAIGLRRILAGPWQTATCYVARAVANLTFPMSLAIWPPSGVQTSSARSLILGLVYSLILLSALWNVAHNWRKWRLWFFPIACTVAFLLAVTPQIEPRFRVPLMPLLAFLAFLPGSSAKSTIADQLSPR